MNPDSSITELNECLFSVQEWMNDVKLKLSPYKSEFFIIFNKYTRESSIPKFPVTFLQCSIILAEEVKHLGVTFDSENTFDIHIGKV